MNNTFIWPKQVWYYYFMNIRKYCLIVIEKLIWSALEGFTNTEIMAEYTALDFATSFKCWVNESTKLSSLSLCMEYINQSWNGDDCDNHSSDLTATAVNMDCNFNQFSS